MKLKLDKIEISGIIAIVAFILIAASATCNAQTTGMNGAGFFENYTPQAETWLSEAVGSNKWVLRVPGGAIAKLADPLSGNGWGLTHEAVDSIIPKYGSDEEEKLDAALAKWHRKTDEQASVTTSYLDELIALHQKFPAMEVIYCANVFISADRSIFPVEYLIAHGVKVKAVELGNESYSQFNYDFDAFYSRTSALRSKIKALGLPIVYPCAATGNRTSASHKGWNDAVNAIVGGEWVTFHPYYDKREFPALTQPVDTLAAWGQIMNWDFEAQFQNMKGEIPNAGGFVVTETNSQPSSLIGDSDLNKLLMDRIFDAGKKAFSYTCIHSGIAPDVYGIIYGTKTQKRNKTYYSFQESIGTAVIDTACYDSTFVSGFEINITTKDSTYISGYKEVYTYTQTFDTIIIASYCYKCSSRLYRMRHKTFCATCTKPYKQADTIITSKVIVDTTLVPVYATITIRDTTYVPIYTTIVVCDSIPSVGGFQPLDADTLRFSNETEFAAFLKHYGMANYEVLPAKYNFDCSVLPPARDYPAQSNDDFLHEERFTGLQGIVFFDHIATRKMLNIFIPTLNNPDADFCSVSLWLKNPNTGQVVRFDNVFSWYDRNGQQIFNTNLKLWLLWGFSSGTISFEIDMIHLPTGSNYAFDSVTPIPGAHSTLETTFNKIAETYIYLKQ